MTFIPLFVALALYPSAPQVWQESPLTTETLAIPSAPVFAETEVLEAQVALFKALPQPASRARLAADFQNVNNRDAFPMLLELLQGETSSFVQDDLLHTLKILQDKGYAMPGGDEVFPRFFHHASPMARGLSMSLYLTLARQPDRKRVLEALDEESSPLVLDQVRKVLEGKPEALDVDLLLNLLKGAKQDTLRAFALQLLAVAGAPQGKAQLQQAQKHPNPMIRLAVATGLNTGRRASPDLLNSAAQDAHPAVRLAAATVTGAKPEQEAILGRLLTDSSSGVRAAAARSLGSCGRKSAALLLLKALADRDHLVVWAAADGLIQLAPDAAVRRQVMDAGQRQPGIRRQVIHFFHGVADDLGGPAAVRWLPESRDDLLTEDLVTYLGKVTYKPGVKAVMACSGHASMKVRSAVAATLEALRVPSSYETLKGLYRDRDSRVSQLAMKAMYAILDPTFVPQFQHALGTRTSGGENRAYGCRALAALKVSNPQIWKNLETLLTVPCISMPMVGKVPEEYSVRVSGFMYFLERGMSGDRLALEKYQQLVARQLQLPSADPMKDELVEEFLKQLEAFRRREKIPRKRVRCLPPDFSAEAILKRTDN